MSNLNSRLETAKSSNIFKNNGERVTFAQSSRKNTERKASPVVRHAPTSHVKMQRTSYTTRSPHQVSSQKQIVTCANCHNCGKEVRISGLNNQYHSQSSTKISHPVQSSRNVLNSSQSTRLISTSTNQNHINGSYFKSNNSLVNRKASNASVRRVVAPTNTATKYNFS